jgi:hypothetical protein
VTACREPSVSLGRLFAQDGGGFLQCAARHMMHEPVAMFFFFLPQPFKKPMHVVAFLRAELDSWEHSVAFAV